MTTTSNNGVVTFGFDLADCLLGATAITGTLDGVYDWAGRRRQVEFRATARAVAAAGGEDGMRAFALKIYPSDGKRWVL